MIAMHEVSKRLGKFQMEDISFELPGGYICGLVGRNGAGKTTLLHLLLGLYRADAGEIVIDGMHYDKEEKMIHDRMGTVLVEELFLPELAIRDNADYFGKYYSGYRWERMEEYLVRFRLFKEEEASAAEEDNSWGQRGIKFGALSKGQKLKCQFAFALACEPEILILDEPTGNFDPAFREQFFQIIQEFIADGKRSVILATHLTEDLDRLTDYLIYLENGRQVFAGDIESFREEYRIVSGERYKLLLIPKDRLICMEEKKYGAKALVQHRKSYHYDAELTVTVPTIEEFMYYYSKR